MFVASQVCPSLPCLLSNSQCGILLVAMVRKIFGTCGEELLRERTIQLANPPRRPREILLIQRGDVPSNSTPALGPSAGLLVNIRMLWYYFIRILQPAKIVNTLLLRNTKVDESGIRKYLCHLQNICFNHLSEYVIIICHKICTDYLQGVPKKITLQKFILGPVRTTHWDHLAPL